MEGIWWKLAVLHMHLPNIPEIHFKDSLAKIYEDSSHRSTKLKMQMERIQKSTNKGLID